MPLFRRRGLLESDAGYGRSRMLLTAPSWGLFVASLIIAAIALVIRYTDIDVPIINAAYVFEVLLIAYAILAAGVVLGRGRF